MKRVIIKDRGLMARRLRMKMIEKGYVHKAGTPHQKMLAEAKERYEKACDAYVRFADGNQKIFLQQ